MNSRNAPEWFIFLVSAGNHCFDSRTSDVWSPFRSFSLWWTDLSWAPEVQSLNMSHQLKHMADAACGQHGESHWSSWQHSQLEGWRLKWERTGRLDVSEGSTWAEMMLKVAWNIVDCWFFSGVWLWWWLYLTQLQFNEYTHKLYLIYWTIYANVSMTKRDDKINSQLQLANLSAAILTNCHK